VDIGLWAAVKAERSELIWSLHGDRKQSALSCIVKRFIFPATDPQIVQQDCQLGGHFAYGTFLFAFSSAFGQLRTPLPEIGVVSERTEDVLRSLYQNHPQLGISLIRLQSHLAASSEALS